MPVCVRSIGLIEEHSFLFAPSPSSPIRTIRVFINNGYDNNHICASHVGLYGFFTCGALPNWSASHHLPRLTNQHRTCTSSSEPSCIITFSDPIFMSHRSISFPFCGSIRSTYKFFTELLLLLLSSTRSSLIAYCRTQREGQNPQHQHQPHTPQRKVTTN